MQANPQTDRVEAALGQVNDIGLQLGEVHLLVAVVRLEEVVRSLANARQHLFFKPQETVCFDPVEVAYPSVLERPSVAGRIPSGAFRMNVPTQLERLPPEVVDVDSGEHLAGRVEGPVEEDAILHSERPLAVGSQVRPRRAPLDLVPEGVLAPVSFGQICLFQGEQSAAQASRHDEDRKRQPVQAHSAGPERRQLVLPR